MKKFFAALVFTLVPWISHAYDLSSLTTASKPAQKKPLLKGQLLNSREQQIANQCLNMKTISIPVVRQVEPLSPYTIVCYSPTYIIRLNNTTQTSQTLGIYDPRIAFSLRNAAWK